MGESFDLSFPSGLSYLTLSESPSTDPHWPGQGNLLTPEPLAVTLSSQPDSCYSTHPKSDLRLRWDSVGETWFAKGNLGTHRLRDVSLLAHSHTAGKDASSDLTPELLGLTVEPRQSVRAPKGFKQRREQSGG